jgi:hypothetical protein
MPVPTGAGEPVDMFTPEGQPPAPARASGTPPRDFRPLRVAPRVPARPAAVPAQAPAPPTEKLCTAEIAARSAARSAAGTAVAVLEPPTTLPGETPGESPSESLGDAPGRTPALGTPAEASVGVSGAAAPGSTESGSGPRHALTVGRDRARTAAAVLVAVTLVHAVAVAYLLGHPVAASALRELLDHLIG